MIGDLAKDGYNCHLYDHCSLQHQNKRKRYLFLSPYLIFKTSK
jgi:hypothetical protein